MLKNIPNIISPKLLKVLDEMGHNDVLVIGDGNFPGKSLAKKGGAHLIRYDSVSVIEILSAVLDMIPIDTYVSEPIILMQKEERDMTLEIPIWKDIERIIEKHDPRGKNAIGHIDRQKFYDITKESYAIVQTGETAIYACIMIRKGVLIQEK